MLSNDSTVEDVVKFFIEKGEKTEEVINKLRNEGISGEVLPLLTDDELKTTIGIKFGPRKKWKNYFQENQDKFPEKEIKEKIMPNSKEEEVKSFFETCLDFKGSLENMNGQKLLDLNEEEMEKLGLNLGKRKKLNRYIKHFKTLIPKEINEEESINFLITKKSSSDEVANFLKTKLKISQDSINEMQLDGEVFLSLEESEIEEFKIKSEEKEQLKNYIKRLKSSEQPKKTINNKSNIQEVSDFLKEAFGISEDIIKDLGLDGESFFTTTEEDIKEFDISEDQRNKWINYMKEINSINEESSKEKVKNFLKNNLSFSDNSLQQMDYDGKELLSLKEFQMNKLDITVEEKKKLKTFLKKDQIKLTNEKDEKSISIFLDDKFGLAIKSFNKENLLKISSEIKEEEKKILEKFLATRGFGRANPIRENINRLMKEIKYSNFQDYKITPIIKNEEYNVIFFVTLKEYNINDYCISIHEEYEDNSYLNHKPKFIYEESFDDSKGFKNRIIFILIQSKIPFKNRLNIILKDYREENKSYIDIKDKIKWYFHFDNLIYDSFDEFAELKIHHIIRIYYNCFFEQEDIDKALKIGLLTEIFNLIDYGNETLLDADTFLSLFKQSLILKVNPKKINSIKIREVASHKRIELEPDDYLSNDDIEKLKLGEQKSKFCDLIVSIYAKSDKIQLYNLIKSKNGKDYCKKVLELIKNKKIIKDDFLILKDKKTTNTIQLNFLSVSTTEDDLNFLLSLSTGLLDNLKFIQDNHKEIYKILDNKHIFNFPFFKYKLNLLMPEDKDDVKDYITILSKIVKLTKDNKNKSIIDYNELFQNLYTFYSNSDRSLTELCLLYNILGLFHSDINDDLIRQFYEKIHVKGLTLIKNGKMKMEEIMTFITSQDKFYCSPKYNRDDRRDPRIFNYIHITDEDKDYSNNLKLIEEKK